MFPTDILESSYFPSGTSYEDLASVLPHEAGGHGFSKLWDEYVEFNDSYDVYGWGKNVGYNSDPSEVKQAHRRNRPISDKS